MCERLTFLVEGERDELMLRIDTGYEDSCERGAGVIRRDVRIRNKTLLNVDVGVRSNRLRN